MTKEIKKELLEDLYSNKKLSANQISKLLKISRPTVTSYLKKFGLFKHKTIIQPPTKEWLYEKYNVENKKVNEIANLMKVTRSFIKRWLHIYQIKRKNTFKCDKNWLEHEYAVENKTINQICIELNKDQKTISKLLEKFGIKKRNGGSVIKTESLKFKNKQWLEENYINKQIGYGQLAKIIKISPTTLKNWLIFFKIPLRTIKEANNLIARKGDKHHNWKNGITTVNNKIRTCKEMKEWIKKVYSRDRFTCQICGDSKGGNLNADHIKPFSIIIQENNIKTFEMALKCNALWDINNGRTLCINCHKQTPTYGTIKSYRENCKKETKDI